MNQAYVGKWSTNHGLRVLCRDDLLLVLKLREVWHAIGSCPAAAFGLFMEVSEALPFPIISHTSVGGLMKSCVVC